MFDPTEPLDEEENDLGGRINSDLPFEEALKLLLDVENKSTEKIDKTKD